MSITMKSGSARRVALCVAIAAIAVSGCNRESLAQEQRQDQRQLAQTQATERRDLQQEQTRQREAARLEVARRLPAAQEAVREERADVAEEQGALRALIEQACGGVAALQRDTCAIPAAAVAGVRNITDGVVLRLEPGAGSRDAVERNVNCYRAIVTARAAPAAVAAPGRPSPPAPVLANRCLLDLEGLDVDVKRSGNRVDVEVTTDSPRVGALRARADELYSGQLSVR